MVIIDTPCSLCGSNEYISRFTKNNFQIATCSKCELVKTLLPKNFDLSTIYDKNYFQGGTPDGYADYQASKKVIKKEFYKILKKLLQFKKDVNANNLLEIGCAYGFFLEMAKDHFRCSGIEISSEATKYAQKVCENVFNGSADKDTLNKIGEINFVVMLDVIEHLPNASITIQNISGNLSKGGIVLLTTGNINSMYAKISGKYWRLMTPPQHVTFFSEKTIQKLFVQHGFKIIEISTPYKLVPLGLILYQLVRRFKIKLPDFILKTLSKIYLPVNLFDAMQVIAVKL